MLRRAALVRTDVSEVLNASFIRVTRICELGTKLAVLLVTASIVPSSPILATLMKEALSSSETLVLIRATPHNIPEDAILHSHRREILKSYMKLSPSLITIVLRCVLNGGIDPHILSLGIKDAKLNVPTAIHLSQGPEWDPHRRGPNDEDKSLLP
jgi:hypothetical protein